MSIPFKFLFAPLDAVGHFNACIGIGQQLLRRGHHVIFVTPNNWKGKLTPLGFEEEYYEEEAEDGDSSDKWGEMVNAMGPILGLSPIEKIDQMNYPMDVEIIAKVKVDNEVFKRIMDTVKPDVVLLDNFCQIPGLMNQGVPWILVMSCSFLVPYENVPPAFTGYSSIEPDTNLWKRYLEEYEKVYKDLFEDFNAWVIKNGGPDLPFSYPLWMEYSPYANIYMCPKELAYTGDQKDPPNFYQFDGFMRSETEEFELPEQLRDLPGKLIYFSMGTIGCSEIGLMKRLVGFLSHSPHRFIVSKGPLGDQIRLEPNMWGANRVPQTKVIPLVDLVITHGGNNTLTEAFYFGKKVIALPLFGDQLDNAQRLHETGFGLQFQPYQVEQKELLEGIEKILGDDLLEKRMKAASQRIQDSRSAERAATVVENVAINNRRQ